MKVKVIIVDLELPPRAKKLGLQLGLPICFLLGGGGIAYASGLINWTDGQPLKADDLNANFAYLQNEVTALQASLSALQSPPSPYRTSTTCSYVTNVGGNAGNDYTACTCSSGEVAISGGAYIEGTTSWLQGSNAQSSTEWDIACANSSGVRVQCTDAFVVCAK